MASTKQGTQVRVIGRHEIVRALGTGYEVRSPGKAPCWFAGLREATKCADGRRDADGAATSARMRTLIASGMGVMDALKAASEALDAEAAAR